MNTAEKTHAIMISALIQDEEDTFEECIYVIKLDKIFRVLARMRGLEGEIPVPTPVNIWVWMCLYYQGDKGSLATKWFVKLGLNISIKMLKR